MTARTRWVGIIVGLLVGNALAVAVLLAMSSGQTGRQVLPDYYERAASWDSAMTEAQASADLGWRAEVVVEGRALTITVVDRAGVPVAGAAVELTVVPRGRVDATVTSTAVASAREAGVYRVTLAGARRGLHDVALRVVRGDERFVDDRLIDVGLVPGGGS